MDECEHGVYYDDKIMCRKCGVAFDAEELAEKVKKRIAEEFDKEFQRQLKRAKEIENNDYRVGLLDGLTALNSLMKKVCNQKTEGKSP